MDSLVALLLFFITTLLPGLALTQRLYSGNLYSKLAVGLGLGTAIVSGELFFYFFIFRFSVSSWLYIFIFVQAIIAFAYLVKQRSKILKYKSEKNRWSIQEKLTVILVGMVILMSVLQAITKPPLTYDAMVIWSLRAKILLRDGQVNFNPDSYYSLGSPHYKAYPWHVSLSEYWLRQLGGGEVSVNFIPVIYFLGIVLIIYMSLVHKIGRLKILILILAFVSLPLVFYHSFNTYADLILAYYIVVAIVFFIKWLEKKEPRLLAFSAFFIGVSFFVKNEGIFYILSWLVVVGTSFYINRKKILWPTIRNTIIALILPVSGWIIFKYIFNLGISDSSLTIQWHPQVFIRFLYTLFVLNSWNIWWFIFVVTVITQWAIIWRERKWWPVWGFFISSFGCFIILYFFTQRSEHALNFTAIGRTMIPLIPLSVILIGLALKKDEVFDKNI